MNESWPSPLKIEVKTSRDALHQLSERDLDGIRPGGFAAVLLTDRLYHGPCWVLVPVNSLTPGGYPDRILHELAHGTEPTLVTILNRFWSNWILDDSVWEKVFAQSQLSLQVALDWCLQHHRPRDNQSPGNLREGRLADALGRFREALDRFVKSNGPQQEGFVHQRLLGHALEQLGYKLNENPIGVPDISATWQEHRSRQMTISVRERLEEWQPSDSDLRELRQQLLARPDSNLDALHSVITSTHDMTDRTD